MAFALCGSEVSGVAAPVGRTRGGGQLATGHCGAVGGIQEVAFRMRAFDPGVLLHQRSVLEPMPAITEDRSTSGHPVRATFVVWARIWSAVFAVMFVGVTALTISLWLTDPEYTETTPVSDLSFLALGAIIGLGFVSQLWTPEHNIAGVQQAIVGIVALGAAGLIGDRIEPLVGSLLFLFAAAILLTLHPARQDFFRRRGRMSAPLGALSIVALGPGVWYAASMLALAADAGPSCFFGECAHGDRFAEMAAAAISIVLVGLLAAMRTPGRGSQSGAPGRQRSSSEQYPSHSPTHRVQPARLGEPLPSLGVSYSSRLASGKHDMDQTSAAANKGQPVGWEVPRRQRWLDTLRTGRSVVAPIARSAAAAVAPERGRAVRERVGSEGVITHVWRSRAAWGTGTSGVA